MCLLLFLDIFLQTDQMAHGGADAWGVPLHDFSTNANAVGPCPEALAAVQQADPSAYPDPAYTALRTQLAAFHAVDPSRVLCMASASEAMARITAAAVRLGLGAVWMPPSHYADVGNATSAWGLPVAHQPSDAGLIWACEPSTPHGQHQPDLAHNVRQLTPHQMLVLDCAYEPLRLSGASSLSAEERDGVWQLWSPNKALGLTGVRAAYLLAPKAHTPLQQRMTHTLQALAPSWPLGVHGVALLQAWCQPSVQAWVRHSLLSLAEWKASQSALCHTLGWECAPSQANYMLVKPQWMGKPQAEMALWRQHHNLKVRDATSFGLPGWIRLGVRPPPSQQALWDAVQHARATAPVVSKA